MKKLLPQPGRDYWFLYPRHNYEGVFQRLEPRVVRVTSIRDTKTDPLDPMTKSADPKLKRGRWLVTGQDLDKGAERSFYLESMQSIREIDGDEQPAQAVEYVVIDRYRVACVASSLGEVVDHWQRERRGIVCSVLRKTTEALNG